MKPIAEIYGDLMGTTQARWTRVLSPVVFVMHNQEALLAVQRSHKARGLGQLLENARVANALSDAFPGDEKFGNFIKDHVNTGAESGVAELHETIFDSALVFGHAILDDILLQCLTNKVRS